MIAKKKITSIAIFAILAIGIGTIAGTSFQDEKLGTQTDPSEFINENYYSVFAQYISTDALELASLSENIVKGKIIDIKTESVPVTDTVEDVPIPNIDRTIYTIKVSENIKGSKNSIDIVTIIPSKLKYEIGDKVLIMTTSFNGENMLLGGPHSMYKLKDGKAIGDELTFDEKGLSDVVKTAKDKSKELEKSKGS